MIGWDDWQGLNALIEKGIEGPEAIRKKTEYRGGKDSGAKGVG